MSVNLIIAYLLLFISTIALADDGIVKRDNAVCISSEVVNGELNIVWKELYAVNIRGEMFKIINGQVTSIIVTKPRIWKDVYSIIDGKIALVDSVDAKIIPEHDEHIELQIIWTDKK